MKALYSVLYLNAFLFLIFINISFASSLKGINDSVLLTDKTSDGVLIKIEIHLVKYNLSMPYRSGFRWGTELKEPKSIVNLINIEYGSNKIFVPLSAYCDLTNMTYYSIKTSVNAFQLVINGGHASTSYRAELFFKNGYIQKRKVTHQEFPDESWEETIYSFRKRGRVLNSELKP